MSKTFLPKKTLIFLIGHFRRLFISALHLLTHLFSSSSLPFPFQFPDPEPFSSLQTMHVLGSSCLKCVHLLSPYFNLHATLSLWLRHPHIFISFSPSDFILSFHSPPSPPRADAFHRILFDSLHLQFCTDISPLRYSRRSCPRYP